MAAERPNSLGKYRLIAELGQGGMATVYLAVASGPAGVNKLLVVKHLRAEMAHDPEFIAMFMDEARLTTRLNHPNIVQTIEVGHDESDCFIVMEYLEGQPLNRIIKSKKAALPLNMHLHLIADSLSGLHYAHELTDYDGTPLGIVHRDISPHNIFVTYDGNVKLVDFGVAKALSSTEKTAAGVIKGKTTYMAPEQARGDAVDRRADIFSIGVMIWEAVTGRRIYQGMSDVTIIYMLYNKQVPSVTSVKPDAPPQLVRIINRALAHEREERYPDALALQADIEKYLRDTGGLVTTREVARTISEAFAEGRAEIKAAVEAQMRALATMPSGEYHVVELRSLGAQMNAAPKIHDPSGSMSGIMTAPLNITSPGTQRTTRTRLDSSTNPGSAIEAPARPASRRKQQIIASVAAAAAVGGVALYSALSAPSLRPAAAHNAASKAHASPGAAAAEVSISFHGHPESARLYVDGKALPSNPYTAKFPNDSQRHEVRVEAPGHVTRSESIKFDREMALDFALQTEPAAASNEAAAPKR